MNTRKLDRRAWLRILEVFIAILLVMGSVLVILARSPSTSDISEEVYEKQRQILDIISKNDSLRKDIIIEKNLEVNNTISKMLPNHWKFATRICGLDNMCPLDLAGTYENDVYSTEVVISSNLTQYSPKKLRFFVWVE